MLPLLAIMISLYSFPPCSSGFLQGEDGAQPQLLAFHPCFKKGALLTVVSPTAEDLVAGAIWGSCLAGPFLRPHYRLDDMGCVYVL